MSLFITLYFPEWPAPRPFNITFDTQNMTTSRQRKKQLPEEVHSMSKLQRRQQVKQMQQQKPQTETQSDRKMLEKIRLTLIRFTLLYDVNK